MPLPMFKENKNSPAHHLIKNVIAIAAGKGGVGKSTVSVNLALALKFLGFKVGIFDADLYGPSIRKMLPEEIPPRMRGEEIVPAVSNGIQIVTMAYFRREDESASVRAPIANKIISQFIEKVIWDDLDFLLIDFPPGTGDIPLTVGQKGRLLGAVMVTTPQEVALLDVKKAIHLFDLINIPILGVIENMSYYFHKETGEQIYIFGKSGGQNFAKNNDFPFLGGIPIDPVLSKFGDEGKSIFYEDTDETHHVRQSFLQLAKNLISHNSRTLKKK